MLGGNALCTHHVTVTPKGSYDGAKAALLREGFEPTLIADPVAGKVGQFLPADRGAFALEHNGPATNTEGRIHVQVEWVWPSMSLDITKAAHFDDMWRAIVTWLDQLGVPRTWPFGFASTSRSAATWRKAGHRGHVNAPGNTHVDNLPAVKRPAWPSVTHPLTDEHRAEIADVTAFLNARRVPLPAADQKRLTALARATQQALDI